MGVINSTETLCIVFAAFLAALVYGIVKDNKCL